MRHVPARTCVACRTRRDKADLVRVVRRPDGSVMLDALGTIDGRGAYLCADRSCWHIASKRSALQRSLRTALPKELEERLEQGDVAAVHVETDHDAPDMITGGTDGT